MVLLAVIFIIIAVIAFVLLKDKLFSSAEPEEAAVGQSTHIAVPEKTKEIDKELFEDKKFNDLENNQAEIPGVEELNLGRENPFIKR